jgi:hypothetical protein
MPAWVIPQLLARSSRPGHSGERNRSVPPIRYSWPLLLDIVNGGNLKLKSSFAPGPLSRNLVV